MLEEFSYRGYVNSILETLFVSNKTVRRLTVQKHRWLFWGTFPGRLISIRGDLEWSTSSPNLAPCRFLWGFLKSKANVNRPGTLRDFKTNIQEEICQDTPAMLVRVMANFRNRITQWMDNWGRQLPDLIFKAVSESLLMYLLFQLNIFLLFVRWVLLYFEKKDVLLPHPAVFMTA